MRNGISFSEMGKLGAAKSAITCRAKRQKLVEEYCQNPKTCKTCSIALVYKKRNNTFCSQSCAAKLNNTGKVKNPEGKNGAIARSVKNNTADVVKPPRAVKVKCFGSCGFCKNKCNRNFCNSKCYGQFRRKTVFDEVDKNGFSPSKTGKVNERSVRKYLLHTRPYKCEICQNETWNNTKIPLVVDHIDGNSTNNELSNLRLICCNCDALTPTYKSKNRGNGRRTRMQRYYEGKSW